MWTPLKQPGGGKSTVYLKPSVFTVYNIIAPKDSLTLTCRWTTKSWPQSGSPVLNMVLMDLLFGLLSLYDPNSPTSGSCWVVLCSGTISDIRCKAVACTSGLIDNCNSWQQWFITNNHEVVMMQFSGETCRFLSELLLLPGLFTLKWWHSPWCPNYRIRFLLDL